MLMSQNVHSEIFALLWVPVKLEFELSLYQVLLGMSLYLLLFSVFDYTVLEYKVLDQSSDYLQVLAFFGWQDVDNI